jgi:hypothetical protein
MYFERIFVANIYIQCTLLKVQNQNDKPKNSIQQNFIYFIAVDSF